MIIVIVFLNRVSIPAEVYTFYILYDLSKALTAFLIVIGSYIIHDRNLPY